jgi:hypothetical protein
MSPLKGVMCLNKGALWRQLDKIQARRRLTGQAALRRRWLRLSAKRAATSLPAF